ncbi:MAG: replicative DNA helicase [Patescibacteria group bacterium]|nr:replicative DNA helicase [Patescibacteria group bacterium]
MSRPSISDTAKKARREKGGRRSQTAATAAEPTFDRLPPHDVEVERNVISCVLQDPHLMGLCVERLGASPQAFYDERHKTIYQTLAEMYDQHEGTDIVTLQARLRSRGVLEEIGGLAALAEIQSAAPSPTLLESYVTILRGKFLQRRLAQFCVKALDTAMAYEGSDVEKVLLEVESDISSLTETEGNCSEEHIKDVLMRVVKDLEENHFIRGKTQLRGLPTGPNGNNLDKLIQGIRETYYFVIAGRPGDGKSSLAMNIVEYLAKDYVWYEPTGNLLKNPETEELYPETAQRQGIPVAVFSIEMDAESLGYRMLFGRAGVDMATFNQGFVEGGSHAKLTKAMAELSRANIYVDCSPAQTIGQIAAKARRMVKQYGIKLFVLDYLQLVEQDGGDGFDRVKELTKISRKIMALKKQLKVPWLVLCQMNRNIETTEAKRVPVLSDLKDCGAIEQDADLVLFLYKPSRKELEDSGDNDKLKAVCGDSIDGYRDGWNWANKPHRINAFVGKNRYGPTGKSELLFCKNLTRFEDWHLWKLRHDVEERKEGESKHLEGTAETADLPSTEEMQG